MFERFRVATVAILTCLVAACSEQPVDSEPLAKTESPVENYMIYYSRLSEQIIKSMHEYDLVIVHPLQGDISAGQIDQIQVGKDASSVDDDVIVLCYLSIGEDIRTYALTDEQMRNDPQQRFTGDRSGPVTDPRGPQAAGQSLRNIDPIGIPSPGGTGFAPYYLDDNNYDGSPDRNGNFDVAFVNAGHPEWFEVVNNMSFSADGTPGLKEMLTDDTAEQRRGLGCDGVFLDTVDTAAPNSFTDELSPNQSEFEWTAPGFTAFIERLRTAYPEKKILQNRGLFFFNAAFPHYEVNPRSLIDYVLFESYQLDSSSEQTRHPYFSADNKHVFRHRLMAEAQRSDGFQVLSLGYAQGPAQQISPETLDEPTEPGGLGFDLLIQDIVEAEELSGFRHYLTDEQIVLTNDFVRLNANRDDTASPVWTSTFNDSGAVFPTPPVAPVSRVGIQRAEPGPRGGEVTVQWDVALDLNPVQYVLYYQSTPFSLADDPDLTGATKVLLDGKASTDYSRGNFATAVANAATIDGLDESLTYYFLVRARDSIGNEDENRTVLSSQPLPSPKQYSIAIDGETDDWNTVAAAYVDAANADGSAGPDWREIRLANDDEHLYIYVQAHAPIELNSYFNIYVDTDLNTETGYQSSNLSGLGADFLMQGTNLYAMQTGKEFVPNAIGDVTTGNAAEVNVLEIAIPLQKLGLSNQGQQIGLTFINDAPPADFAPDLGEALIFELVPSPSGQRGG